MVWAVSRNVVYAGPHFLRSCWLHDWSSDGPGSSGGSHREVHAVAQPGVGQHHPAGHQGKTWLVSCLLLPAFILICKIAFFLLQNVDILKDAETVRQLGSILKTNVRACKAVGHPFVVQLGRIYLDMLNVYKCLSENISSAVQTNGKWTTSLVKGVKWKMRQIICYGTPDYTPELYTIM